MAPVNGRLEARVRIPTGGVALTLSDASAGPWTVTVPAGDYFLSTADSGSNSLLAELKAQLDASSAGTYTVSLGGGEGGTGKVTISVTGVASYSITWAVTYLRDLLGFTANISAQTTSTGANHAEPCWLPDCPSDAAYGLTSEGADSTDLTISEGPTRGAYRAYAYGQTVRQRIIWSACQAKKVRADKETVVGESFQSFWRGFMVPIYAETWATLGGPLRWYPDAASLTYYEYYLITPGPEFAPERVRADWDGLYRIEVIGVAA